MARILKILHKLSTSRGVPREGRGPGGGRIHFQKDATALLRCTSWEELRKCKLNPEMTTDRTGLTPHTLSQCKTKLYSLEVNSYTM